MTLVSETLHKQNHCGNHMQLEMKNLPTLRNNSSFAVQLSNSVSKTRAVLLFTIKIIQINVWTPRKHATDAIRWISSDNPAIISHSYT